MFRLDNRHLSCGFNMFRLDNRHLGCGFNMFRLVNRHPGYGFNMFRLDNRHLSCGFNMFRLDNRHLSCGFNDTGNWFLLWCGLNWRTESHPREFIASCCSYFLLGGLHQDDFNGVVAPVWFICWDQHWRRMTGRCLQPKFLFGGTLNENVDLLLYRPSSRLTLPGSGSLMGLIFAGTLANRLVSSKNWSMVLLYPSNIACASVPVFPVFRWKSRMLAFPTLQPGCFFSLGTIFLQFRHL